MNDSAHCRIGHSAFWPFDHDWLFLRESLDILLVIRGRRVVNEKSSQRKMHRQAVRKYRRRLAKRGMARFEVLGRDADRELIRSFARRLAEDGPGADRLRTIVRQGIAGEQPQKGGVLQALRRSPLVGADVIPPRPFEQGRKVDL